MRTQATAVLVQRALAAARRATDPEECEEIWTLLAQAAADGPGSLLLGRDLLHLADPVERRTGCDLLRLTSELHPALQRDAATELVALAASEQELRVLGPLAHALGATCDTRSLPVLLALAGHHDAQVRLQVAVALPTVAVGEPDGPALHTLIRLTRDTDPEVRNWATFGLGFQLEADTPVIRAALWDRTSDDNTEAREEGIRGLARRHDPGAVPLLAQLLDDPRGAHVSDSYDDQIVVTDFTGKVVTKLTGLSQVRGLELSPDSGTLYAAVYGADKIVAIDTAQLTQTAEYPTGDKTIPSRLAYADGKLWFGYGDQWESGLGEVDLTAETPTVTLDLAAGHDFTSPPMLYADPDNPGTLVEIWADPYGADKPATLVKSGTVDSSGNLSVTLTLKRKTKLTAKFAGDARYAPKATTSTVGTKVKVSTALGGYYKTKYTWNHTYYYFHQSKDPVVTTTMTPYPGRTQLLQIQIYSGGVWQTTDKQYFKLDSAGKSVVTITGTPPTGYRFRVRDSYISGSGDSVNTTTYGAWKYFTFTS